MLQRCKFLGRTISFTLGYIGIRKHFLKHHFPRVSAKALACICVTIFYTLYGSALLAHGRGGGGRGGGGGAMIMAGQSVHLTTLFPGQGLEQAVNQ